MNAREVCIITCVLIHFLALFGKKHSMLCCEFPVLLKLFILLQIYLAVTLDLCTTISMSLMFIIFDNL